MCTGVYARVTVNIACSRLMRVLTRAHTRASVVHCAAYVGVCVCVTSQCTPTHTHTVSSSKL